MTLRMPMTSVGGAGRKVLPTWATLAAESSSRMKEKTQSDLSIGLIVAPYFLALIVATSAPSFIKQELARFSNDQRFVYNEHVVVSIMQFDDSRVLHARAKALDYGLYRPVRKYTVYGHSYP